MRSPTKSTRPRFRLRLADILFATVPLAALAAYVLGSAWLDYARIRNYDDWWSNRITVRRLAWHRVKAALDLPRATRLRERIAADDPERATLRLRVDRGELAELSRDVGGHWGTWIDAPILAGDREVPAELRFRGDGSAHWTADKKSFGLKTGKDVLYQGYRRLNFSLKDVLPQYLVNSLARDFELLAPRTEVVPVFLNDHYHGIYRFVEPVDESFLRGAMRMPGNVYRADAAERGEYFKDLPRDVFLNPVAWERVANNDRPGAPEAWGIHLLLDDLAGATIEDHVRLMDRLDRDELARLLALMLLSGDPFHMSGVHNQLWYDDPVSGTLHPIVWDLRLLDLERPPPASNWNRLWREVLRDPRFMDRVLTRLATRLEPKQADPLLEAERERVETVYETYRDHFEYDRLREGAIHPVGDPESTLAVLRGNVRALERWIDEARAKQRVTRLADGTWLVDVHSSGRAPVVLEGFNTNAESGLEVFADRDLDGLRSEGDERLALVPHSERPGSPAGSDRLVRDERLAAAWSTAAARLEPRPMDYRYFVVAPGATRVEPVFSHGLRYTPLAAGELEPGAAATSPDAWHPWELARLETPLKQDLRLAGSVRVDEDLVVEHGGTLVIEPGTTISLAPDVSILVKGELRAEGTAEAPIRVTSTHAELPFGTFALQGPGADGSYLSHVTFERGGGDLLERVEYKGSVNVYGASRVEFEDCTFRDNRRCDDLLNVVKGDVDLVRCRFEGANADSIDYDMSTGTIRDCEVVDSGNDGLDLMTCSPYVWNTRISGSGDKGISIGEAATPRIEGTTIEDCVVGIEVKDGSTPRLDESTIAGCEIGVLARRKNWRYPVAGRPTLFATAVERNAVDFELRDGGTLTSHPAWPGYVAEELPLGSRFGAPAAGWKAMGGARRIESVDGDLRASFRLLEGAIGRPLDWQPTRAHSRADFVAVSAAGRGIRSARLGLTADGSTLEVPLVLDTDPARFRVTVLTIPEDARRLEAIALSVLPEAEGAVLTIRSVQMIERRGGMP